MGHGDWTDMGGVGEKFLTTHWSQVEEVKREGDRDSVLIGLLLERYWKPVYCFLRRKGYGNEKAKDLTQGFFCDVILDRGLVQRAAPTNGSFRSLLLHALRHFVIDAHRTETAAGRIPKEKLTSLNWADPPALQDATEDLDPEESFHYAWKADLLERALSEVKGSLIARSMETHWLAFHDRVLQPAIRGARRPSMKAICTRFGIDNEARASHMVETVKRNLRRTLEDHVRQTVCGNEDLAEELGEIAKFLKTGSENA